MQIVEKFNSNERYVINLIKNLCNKLNVHPYIVGGAVRDALINEKILDIDICVDCNPMKIISKLNGIKDYKYYEKFQTSTITFNNEVKIDLIRCRKEKYTTPGVLPDVEPGTLEDDLYRRDFTINALAYDIKNEKIIDFFNGISDLKSKTLKKVHKNSYKEDPTRIFRAIKYKTRYDLLLFNKEEIKDNVANKVIRSLSNDRIIKEIELMCKEEKWIENILNCDKLDIFNIDCTFLGCTTNLSNYENYLHRLINLYVVIKDKKFKNIFINNSIFNKNLRKSLEKLLWNSEFYLDSIYLNNYRIYRFLKKCSEYELLALSYNRKLKYRIENYLKNMKYKNLKIDYELFNKYGVIEGKQFGKAKENLIKIKLNTMLDMDYENNLVVKYMGEIKDGIKCEDR